ncbi:type VII toxin-antitoxin system MntA family adenylyltransferase antitoxin [Desulforamulus hydrothermalis]|uniref:DNA polymerase, beta domain protein region n=1 Tax=Desulforamulus hydrothermalis Lam5 = DSM 18033 TaxID=1121428 RepID=K8E0S9_9FIRM|nr:nucleotidyltransferase domain-containing protein [Desulforamulus hydrothermalis]CCO09150.1 DNA polymerase, beta domain protein region [Desulforamulus hydrothermalis Lam5 = DSM 18033]SHH11644.1 Nucleotidyltransferase domain-containing protein [Desulforamulus hydrothermalis Lam5 = DSM 18033]
MHLDDKAISIIKQYLAEKIAPYLIILFGSAADGRLMADSDIDIAFLSEQKFSDYEVFLTGQGLADLLNRDIDLVDLEKASTVFQARVLSTGKIIYSKDENKRMFFYMLVYKKYAKLNEERQCILKKIEESGCHD